MSQRREIPVLPAAPDVIKFLIAYRPEEFAALNARHPLSEAALRPVGSALGPVEDATIDAVRTLLSTVGDVVSSALLETTKKLKRASQLDITGTLVSLLSSGGVVGVVLANASRQALWLGAVAFVSAAAPQAAKWMRGLPLGDGTVASRFLELREIAWGAGALQAELQRLRASDTGLSDLILRVNELAKKAYLALTDLGYQPKFRAI